MSTTALPFDVWKVIICYLGAFALISLSKADIPVLHDFTRSYLYAEMIIRRLLPFGLWDIIIRSLESKDLVSLSKTRIPVLRHIALSELYRETIASVRSGLFPLDLSDKIIRSLESKHLGSLLKTNNRFLRDISRSELYRETSVWDDTIRLAYSRVPLEHEATYEDFARLTRNFRYFRFDSVIPWMQTPILCEISPLWNLRSLSLSGVIIDNLAFDIIQTLPYLNCLILFNCAVDPALVNVTFQIVANHALTRREVDFTVRSPKSLTGFRDPVSTDEWVAITPGARLVSLTVDHLDVEFSGSFLLGLLSSGRHEFLETLDCGDHVLPSPKLVHFLESTPLLRKIVLYDGYDISCAPPATALPFLGEFNGPVSLCEAFVTGRPVHTVSLTLKGNDNPHDILHSLEQSTGPVQDLKLRFDMLDFVTPGPMGAFMTHAPTTLRHFSWDRVGKDSFRSFVGIIGRFHDLRSLHGILAEDGQAVSEMEPNEYFELVQDCAAANVSLRQIIFTAQASPSTDGKWVRRNDGTWECFLVVEDEN